MTDYAVNAHRHHYTGGSIEFETNDDEFYEEVIKFIEVYADACSWRNRVEEVKYIKADEETDEN